uniref:Immediate early response 3-interacting protein 1 n=1 Tax=Peromyscus maniculatus bairdii TaxID=230844 RepID=A0A8C8W621_PERMB
MTFTLYSRPQAALLWVNAITILHKEHFLKNIGWGTDQGIGRFREEWTNKGTDLVASFRNVIKWFLARQS